MIHIRIIWCLLIPKKHDYTRNNLNKTNDTITNTDFKTIYIFYNNETEVANNGRVEYHYVHIRYN